MSVNWNEFKEDVKTAIEDAAARTDERLASKISSVTRMTDEEIMELFPVAGDAEKLVKLLAIVNSADNQNTKINNILENAKEFAGIILTLVKRV